MSVERYANGVATTLASDITTTNGTSLSVASASGFPSTGNFRVLIDSELLICTAVSGTTFTVIRGAEGTTAATHSSGATVTHVLSRDGLRGVFSQVYGGGFRQAPRVADFAWINQETASAIDTVAGVTLVAAKQAETDLRILKKAAPSTPYTITAVIRSVQASTNYSSVGLCFRQSSDGKIHSFARAAGGGWYSTKWSDASSFSADYANLPGAYIDPFTIRIADDGTNRICSLSPDGENFVVVHSVGRTDYLTADEVGVFIHIGQNSFDVIAHLLAWEEA